MEKRDLSLKIAYRFLEGIGESAIVGDLERARKLNTYLSGIISEEFGSSLSNDKGAYVEGSLGSNFDLARNKYLWSFQEVPDGCETREEVLKIAGKYLSKIHEQLADEGIRLTKQLDVN